MAFEPKMAASKAAIPSIGTDTIRQPEKAPGPYDCTGAGGGEEEVSSASALASERARGRRMEIPAERLHLLHTVRGFGRNRCSEAPVSVRVSVHVCRGAGTVVGLSNATAAMRCRSKALQGQGCRSDAGVAARRRIASCHCGLQRHQQRAPLRCCEGPGVRLQGNTAAALRDAASRGRLQPQSRAAARSWPMARHAVVRGRTDECGAGAGAAGARALDRHERQRQEGLRPSIERGPASCGGEARGPGPAGRWLLADPSRLVDGVPE
eukprot:scaffold82583_cov60-Phaeocystis_antarctica.AAC.2